MTMAAADIVEVPKHRALITATAILASMIYSIDWTIAAVALPHMQGTFSVTQDQIAWVMTSYIVVSAIALPTTGWLSSVMGRKRLFLTSIAGFTIFSLLCGAATSLPAEIAFRGWTNDNILDRSERHVSGDALGFDVSAHECLPPA